MDTLDEALVILNVCRCRYVVGDVRVVGAQVDNHEIRRLLLAKVPGLRLTLTSRDQAHIPLKCTRLIGVLQPTSPGFRSTPARVSCVEPLVALSPGVPPALLVRDADTWEGRDRVLCVPESFPDAVSEARERLVRVVHA